LRTSKFDEAFSGTNVPPGKCVAGKAILSARPFKKRQLVGVFLWALADRGYD
jgi:hypothetical protein